LRAVLFDLDGTLIDSIDNIVACWQHTTRTLLGREIDRADVLPIIGRTLIDSFEEMAPGRGEEMLVEYRAFQATCHDDMVKLVPGTRDTLEKLKASGLLLGVVTSKGIVTATNGLNLFDLRPYFDVLVTLEDTTRHKPNAEPLLAACDRLGIQPDEAIYVGDAVVDILCGKAAGTPTAGVMWGAGTREALESAGADWIFEGIGDLEILKKEVPVT
jgi:pyrophosphatase PpaX